LVLSALQFIQKLEHATGNLYSDDQKEAIAHAGGPLWVTAGPGSGKTEVLVARTLKLIVCDEIRPESIILTTFTERAARSLLDRISSYIDVLGYGDTIDATGLKTGTLHSLCNSIMRDFRYPDYSDLELLDQDSGSFFIYNQDQILDYFKKNWRAYEPLFAGQRVSHTYGPNKWAAAGAATFIFDRITEFRVDVDRMENSGNSDEKGLARIYKNYRKILLENYRCNLSVLQEYFLNFLNTIQGREFLAGDKRRGLYPIKYLLVDEFQDTNPIQEDIYFEMAGAIAGNITVVGDDDQALYRFRGGTVDSLVSFGDRCLRDLRIKPKTVNINDNLRSHPGIVRWINKYISSEPVMQKKGARAPGKRDMIAKGPVKGDYPAVSMLCGSTVDQAADKLADFLDSLIP
jgi:DNA helicase-2/ATP-dependent DNA helicase PcrA